MAKWLRLSICMDYVFELTALAPAHEWRESSSVLRPRQHSIGYMGDGFYRSKDPTNSIKVLKKNLQKTNQTTETTQNTHAETIIETKNDIHT